MIDVGTAARSGAHAEPSLTVAAVTGKKRKWVDLRVIVTKCLTTVAKHSGLWVRVICENIEEACCCLVSFWFSGWMHKCCRGAIISNHCRKSSLHKTLHSFQMVFHVWYDCPDWPLLSMCEWWYACCPLCSVCTHLVLSSLNSNIYNQPLNIYRNLRCLSRGVSVKYEHRACVFLPYVYVCVSSRPNSACWAIGSS